MREILNRSERIVVKAGTSVLTTSTGRVLGRSLAKLAREIAGVVRTGKEVVLVSSGAIAFGMEACGLKQRPKFMARLQACAAIGQARLMNAYEKYFSREKLHTAQILLTRDGLENRKRFINARRTLEELLAMKRVPVVNENDTVSNEEIAFGDNDILSVQVAQLVHADLLILLSDVDGFQLHDGSRLREVASPEEMDGRLAAHLKEQRSERTVGGMKAKLQASRLAMALGIPLMIVNGHAENILSQVLSGRDVGTLFFAHGAKKNSRKKWIAYSAARKGTLVLDEGARAALVERQRSLLPSGIVEVQGHFDSGQVVELTTPGGHVFGRGLVRYSSRELAQIAGKKSHEISAILGYKHYDEVIHRNDLVLWG